jgi:hypothetical protein
VRLDRRLGGDPRPHAGPDFSPLFCFAYRGTQCELPAGFRTNSSFGSKQGYFSPNVVHDTDHPWPSTVVQWLIGTDMEAGVPYVQDLDNGKSYLVMGFDLYGGTDGTNAIWGPDLGFSIEYTTAS